jgi:hypothetical protein
MNDSALQGIYSGQVQNWIPNSPSYEVGSGQTRVWVRLRVRLRIRSLWGGELIRRRAGAIYRGGDKKVSRSSGDSGHGLVWSGRSCLVWSILVLPLGIGLCLEIGLISAFSRSVCLFICLSPFSLAEP